MCQAVRFHFDERDWEVSFRSTRARLPVFSRKQGQSRLMTWGRRPNEQGVLPVGAWANLAHIHGGRWDQYRPRGVYLTIGQFMEQDVAGRPRWFEVTKGQYIQGLIATLGKEQRLYVVTMDVAPGEMTFERWPRIMAAI